MTRMIPSAISHLTISQAEKRLFNLFKTSSGTENWVCLHSLALADHSYKRYGEIDFLMLTRKGIVVLEVKGGRVSRKDGLWTFTNRHGQTNVKKEGPFEQASSAMFSLEKTIKKHFKEDPRLSNLLFGFGVMFPDIVFDIEGVDFDKRQVFDQNCFERPITNFIDQIASYSRESDLKKRCAPTNTDIENLVTFLRKDFDLVPNLSSHANNVSEKMLSLEKEQYAVLDAIENSSSPRVLIQGPAGTGKTLLAMEIAVRESRKHSGEVLFLCFNRFLMEFVADKIKTSHPNEKIIVKTLFGFGDIILEQSSNRSELKEELHKFHTGEESLSILEYLIDHKMNPRFKTVIIDEAQDMMTQNLLDSIDACMYGGLESGNWWVFCDKNNQAAVFGKFEETAFSRLKKLGENYPLYKNLRNTRQISDETIMLTRPKICPHVEIDGVVPVKTIFYKNKNEQTSKLKNTLLDLMKDQVRPSKITVLSPLKNEAGCATLLSSQLKNSELNHKNRLILLNPLTSKNIASSKNSNSTIFFCSISAFKGLEKDFIVITDIDNLSKEWWRSVLYVGMSRARVGLTLLLNNKERSTYDAYLKDWIRNDQSNTNSTELVYDQ
jgi:superfamily I DNA and RNA helicase